MDKYQITLVEKDEHGVSDTWRLDDVNGVRHDDNYYTKYIAGAYNASAEYTIVRYFMSTSIQSQEQITGKNILSLCTVSGKWEVMFLKHLYKLYKPRYSGVRVIFRHYKGGSPLDVVNHAAKYEREKKIATGRIVVVDNDRGDEEMNKARTEAERNRH